MSIYTLLLKGPLLVCSSTPVPRPSQNETHLMQDRPDEFERQRREFVLLQEVVQILLEHLEHQTRVVLVLETLEGAHEIELVRILLAEPRQDGHLDLTLARVRRMVLEDLDGHDVVGAALPTFDHLAEGAATEKLEDLQKKLRKRERENVLERFSLDLIENVLITLKYVCEMIIIRIVIIS